MKEEVFFENLKKSLNILTNEAVAEEIQYYKNLLNEKRNEGNMESDLLKIFGSVNSVRDTIYFKRGIDSKKISQKKGFFYRQFEELFETIRHVVDVMSKNSFRENLKIFFDLFLLIVLICLIKIPFIFVENLGDSLFEVLQSSIVTTIWGFVIDIVYIIVAIMVFMNVFTRWFKNIQASHGLKVEKNIELPKKDRINGKELESINLSDKKD